MFSFFVKPEGGGQEKKAIYEIWQLITDNTGSEDAKKSQKHICEVTQYNYWLIKAQKIVNNKTEP